MQTQGCRRGCHMLGGMASLETRTSPRPTGECVRDGVRLRISLRATHLERHHHRFVRRDRREQYDTASSAAEDPLDDCSTRSPRGSTPTPPTDGRDSCLTMR